MMLTLQFGSMGLSLSFTQLIQSPTIVTLLLLLWLLLPSQNLFLWRMTKMDPSHYIKGTGGNWKEFSKIFAGIFP